MTWRMAKSLEVLREQINTLAPNRAKSSDGGIGNAEHASRSSDHNPWVTDGAIGVVTARDFTNDPAHGMSSQALAEAFVASRDPRIKYVISNRKICSGTDQGQPAWVWRPYTGSNPHNHHCHISVKSDKAHYDDQRPWIINLAAPAEHVAAKPAVPNDPMLREGSKGDDVKRLQSLLNENGASIAADGYFGPGTKAAVTTFQKKAGLVADGIAGRYTWEKLAASSLRA